MVSTSRDEFSIKCDNNESRSVAGTPAWTTAFALSSLLLTPAGNQSEAAVNHPGASTSQDQWWECTDSPYRGFYCISVHPDKVLTRLSVLPDIPV